MFTYLLSSQRYRNKLRWSNVSIIEISPILLRLSLVRMIPIDLSFCSVIFLEIAWLNCSCISLSAEIVGLLKRD